MPSPHHKPLTASGSAVLRAGSSVFRLSSARRPPAG